MTFFSSLDSTFERINGIKGSIMYLVILICVIFGHYWINTYLNKRKENAVMINEEGNEPDPPRNFSLAQLRYFNGEKDEKYDDIKPVYISLNGIVFNVTKGKDFYGPGGPYDIFSGRECGAALAKMSFSNEHLDDISACSNLNAGEKEILEEWIQKFTYYKCYPIVGRLVPQNVLPSSERIISKEELALNNGKSDIIPKGYATVPIFVGLKDKVFDVSFGGVTLYSEGCSYFRFAGKDVSRALAKMSFQPEDIENMSTIDLTEKQLEVLDDWCETFENKKLYPCVGRLEK